MTSTSANRTTATNASESEIARAVDVRLRIAGVADLLGADELAVLETVAHGLARGRDVYGELVVASDQRDMKREAAEEIRDSLVYLGAELVRLNRGGAR